MSTSEDRDAQKKGLMRRAMQISSQTTVKKQGLLSKAVRSKRTERDAIVEQNGIFMINNDLETSSVKQDPALKALIDSVLS